MTKYNDGKKIHKNKWYLYSEESGVSEVADTKKELFAYDTEKISSGIYYNKESGIYYYRGDQLMECIGDPIN